MAGPSSPPVPHTALTPTPTPAPTPAPLKTGILDGKITDATVVDTLDIISNLEKGSNFDDVHAIVIHQTGSSTAESTLSAWKKNKDEGAHFLIDTDGHVTQTARLNQMTWNVGKLRSRCMVDGTCTAKTSSESKILYAKGKSYGTRVKDLHDHEKLKSYPARYPTNDDSIAIELVGSCDAKAASIPKGEKCAYVAPTGDQNAALTRLVNFLKTSYSLTDADVYRHPTISAKTSTEAKDADWNVVAMPPAASPTATPTPTATPLPTKP
jgi:hypothetical protein